MFSVLKLQVFCSNKDLGMNGVWLGFQFQFAFTEVHKSLFELDTFCNCDETYWPSFI